MKIFNTNNKKKWFMLVGSGVIPTGGGFVPITNFPAFTNYISSSSLTPFINNLYTYAIGIAAILAVVEIIWGGFLWMGSGASISNKEAGRSKILMSILGLVLVLSPYLILSVINPNILNLKLGSNNLSLNMNDVSNNQSSSGPLTGQAPPNYSDVFKSLSGKCSDPQVKTLMNINGYNKCSSYNETAIGGLSLYLDTSNSANMTKVVTQIPQNLYKVCNAIENTNWFTRNVFQNYYRVIKVASGGCYGVTLGNVLSNSCKVLPPPAPKDYICIYNMQFFNTPPLDQILLLSKP